MVHLNDIVQRECRFVVYCPGEPNRPKDLHLVKEILHLKDGSQIPNVRIIQNYKRPYYITRPAFRNHQDKKEMEYENKLQKFETTQKDLVRHAAKALEKPWFEGGLRQLSTSPYLYGSDILSTALIKQEYRDRWPEANTLYSIATFDTETDVLHGTDQIIMATTSYKDKVYTAVQANFVKGYSRVLERLQELKDQYIKELVDKRNIKWEVEIVANEAEVIIQCAKKFHLWKPDFVAIWNIDFDISKIINGLGRAGIDPKDIFSDPKIPKEFRFFEYKRGPSQKVTASGKITPIKPAARWHTVLCPSSFYFIDAMCAYRHIRVGNPEEVSYSLDAILKKHKLDGKLKFEAVEHLGGLSWHIEMQKKYPLEYIVYNVVDAVAMEELDEATMDLCLSLPSMSGCSDFRNFKSQPRRLVDALHFFVQNQDKRRIIGTTGEKEESEDDLNEKVVELGGWISMLPSHLIIENGLKIIEEYPDLIGNARRDVADLDVAASYPNGQSVLNISKETTVKEIVSIDGVDTFTQRMHGINISSGGTNATEVMTNLLKVPTLVTFLQAFEEDLNQPPTLN